MRRGYVIVIAGFVASAAAAGAFDVAWFYGPNVVVGDANVDAPASPAGLKCRFSFGEGYYRLAAGAGFGDYIYCGGDYAMIPEDKSVENVPTVIFTAGGDFGRPFGRWRPYAGGGAALALQVYDLTYETRVEGAPGLFAEAGVRYRLGDRWALEAAPRFTYLWDERITVYDFINRDRIHRTDRRSKLLELLVGFDYAF